MIDRIKQAHNHLFQSTSPLQTLWISSKEPGPFVLVDSGAGGDVSAAGEVPAGPAVGGGGGGIIGGAGTLPSAACTLPIVNNDEF